MNLRYNFLRWRDYWTVSGVNYVDGDFGNQWCELTMTNAKYIKNVRHGSPDWVIVKALEQIVKGGGDE